MGHDSHYPVSALVARPSPPAPRRRSRKAEDHAPPEIAKLEASNRDRRARDNGGKTAGISKATDQDGKPSKDDGWEKDQYLEPWTKGGADKN